MKDSRFFRYRGIHTLISYLEMPIGNTGTMMLVFFCVVFLRGILEGLLEYEQLLGIRAVPAVSQAMLFLHFPVFYGAVFLLMVIIISALSNRGIHPVSHLILRWWPLLLLPPLFDWFISGGTGYRLGYIFTPRDIPRTLWRFWLPVPLAITGVTPGMRLEISLACMGVGIYIAFKRSALAGIVGFLTTFTALLLLGAIPALGASAGLAGGWMSAGGFGNLQSHRFAILYGLVCGVLGILILRRANPVLFRAWIQCFRWLRTLLYVLLPALGFWSLYRVFRPWLDDVLLKPGDWISIAALILCQAISFQSAALFNDLADEPWDRNGVRKRIFLMPGVTRSQVKILGWILFGSGLFLAVCVQYAVFLIVLIQHSIAWVYSYPPWRAKRIPVVSTLIIALAAVLSFMAGGAVIGREWIFATMPRGLSLALFVSFILGFGFKDVADEVDDRKAGVRTIPVILGSKGGKLFYAFCIATASLSFPVISGLSSLWWPALLFAVFGSVIILRAGASGERSLIVAFLIVLIVVGIAIELDSRWLIDQRERIRVCLELESLSHDTDSPGGINGWRSVSDYRDNLVAGGIELMGAYPWIIPELCNAMDPGTAGELLERAASGGVCPAISSAAGLGCFARVYDRVRWCDALERTLVWNEMTPDLCAVAGRQADELGFSGTAAGLLSHGRDRWPANAAVWGETGRFLMKRNRVEEALHALRIAYENDPGSTELKADIEYIEELLMQRSPLHEDSDGSIE